MVDIHTHLMPGIDDGARDWKDVYEMAAMAADSGVDTIVCTHHSNMPGVYDNYNSRALDTLFHELRERLWQGEFPLRIFRGMEIFATPDICDKIWAGKLIPLNRTRYFLVEFSFGETPEYMTDLLYDMKRQGMYPIVAHPERYEALAEDPLLLSRWMKRGILSQINKSSLLGKFGSRVEQTALTFMEHNLVTSIASDAHRPYTRTTHMEEICRFLVRHYSEETAWRLLDENPRRIVEGKRIEVK